jgi:hypothetical protein
MKQYSIFKTPVLQNRPITYNLLLQRLELIAHEGWSYKYPLSTTSRELFFIALYFLYISSLKLYIPLEMRIRTETFRTCTV